MSIDHWLKVRSDENLETYAAFLIECLGGKTSDLEITRYKVRETPFIAIQKQDLFHMSSHVLHRAEKQRCYECFDFLPTLGTSTRFNKFGSWRDAENAFLRFILEILQRTSWDMNLIYCDERPFIYRKDGKTIVHEGEIYNIMNPFTPELLAKYDIDFEWGDLQSYYERGPSSPKDRVWWWEEDQ